MAHEKALMDELSPRQVTLDDSFWSPRLATNAGRAIFHQWEQLEASGCIDNFRILCGEKDGFREGWFFADSDAYKWLDAAARIYASAPEKDPALARLMDEFIALLGRAQAPDGYLFTYNQIHFPTVRWANLQIEHELYCHGHLIEAGVSHHAATGRDDLLSIARRAADRVVADFQGGGPRRTPGHEEIEIALLRLYQATGHRPYLEMARQFIEQRGRSGGVGLTFGLALLQQNSSVEARRKAVEQARQTYRAAHPGTAASRLPAGNFAKRPPGIGLRWNLNALSGQYFQEHAPIRQQTTPVGHAVRFGYLQTAIAMLHRLQPDASLLPALEAAWERMVTRRMYVTGGLGSLPALEGFGRDWELDPEYAYNETCAALASMFWNWEMALISGAAPYSALFEWQLYNAAGVGMGLNGEGYLYNNPLACRGGVTRNGWFQVPCCPSNLSRTWADLGKYIYSTGPGGVWVHQYIGSQVKLESPAGLHLALESGLPFSGKASLRLDLSAPAEFCLHLRIPSWSGSTWVAVNGDTVDVPPAPALDEPTAQGYDPRLSRFLPIERTWAAGDVVELLFDPAITLHRAHPKVRGHRGRVAVTRGPLVYCLESPDNPGVDLFTARLDPDSLRAEPEPDLLGGVTVVRAATMKGQPLTFIPYALWANRGESQMVVWVRCG